MSKPAWGISVSAFFGIFTAVLPLPDNVKIIVCGLAALGLVISCVGWYRAHRREKEKNKGLVQPKEPRPTDMSDQERQRLLITIRDLIHGTSGKPLSEKIDVIGALIRSSPDFQTEQDVVWLCEQLENRQFQNPFKIVESGAPGVFEGRKLEALMEARTAKIEIRNITSFISFVAKYWSHADDYKHRRHIHLGLPQDDLLDVGTPCLLDYMYDSGESGRMLRLLVTSRGENLPECKAELTYLLTNGKLIFDGTIIPLNNGQVITATRNPSYIELIWLPSGGKAKIKGPMPYAFPKYQYLEEQNTYVLGVTVHSEAVSPSQVSTVAVAVVFNNGEWQFALTQPL